MDEISLITDDCAFVGCPGDAEPFFEILDEIYSSMFVPGVKPRLYHWRSSYDPIALKGAVGDQLKILRTSSSQTNPVFILFANTVGSPVRLPQADRELMRAWLDANGWPFVAMVGDPDFSQPGEPPANRIPMSGTIFELFDALRTGADTDLRVFDLRQLVPVSDPDNPKLLQQKAWCDRLLLEFGKNFALFAPSSIEGYRREAAALLQSAFGVGRLNPLRDDLPGLEALSGSSAGLFGRDELVRSLTIRILGRRADGGDAAPCTCVVGVSGTGKSSLLRAGLIGYWFRARPQGPGHRSGVTALLLEPALLQLEPNQDPLQSLARLLAEWPARPDRVVGPFPKTLPLNETAPPLAAATGDLEVDLNQALAWWTQLTASVERPLVLVLDQAEQVEAIARRAASRAAKADVKAEVLPPEWLRFTALLAALAGLLDPNRVSEGLAQRAQALAGRVRLVLGLHRISALELWPLKPGVAEQNQVDVAPLRDAATLESLIVGTCAQYGLTLEPTLLRSMVHEATELADLREGGTRAVRGMLTPGAVIHAAASVLPQLVTALQLILTHWRDRWQSALQVPAEALQLDHQTYCELAKIGGSIHVLGERAWSEWQQTEAAAQGVDVRGLFARQQIERKQRQILGQLMARLVDATSPGTQDLTYLERGNVTVRRHDALVSALRRHRLLTSANEVCLVLPHRSILEHWARAQEWLEGARQRLDHKALANGYGLRFAPERWTAEEHEWFAALCLDWIGNEEGEDAQLKAHLQAGLVARMQASQVDSSTHTYTSLLPFVALVSGDAAFANALWCKLLANEVTPLKASDWALALAEVGDAEMLNALLDAPWADGKAIANGTGRADGLFPLLMAAQDGHHQVVESLLQAGANVDRMDEKSGAFPLLQAAQNGHIQTVEKLLKSEAKVDAVHAQLGLFPLLQAAKNGHSEIVHLLLQAGAQVDKINDRNGHFPLLSAAENGHSEVVRLLLLAGAQADRANVRNGCFPLLQAAMNGHTEVVQSLLRAGTVVDQVGGLNGDFPLLLAARNGRHDTVRLLLDAGAKPNRVHQPSGNFPLVLAARNGQREVVQMLLQAGAQADQAHEASGIFSLLLAAQEGHGPVVDALLNSGAQADRVHEQSGLFPLFQAAQDGHVEVVNLLLHARAHVDRVHDSSGEFPLLVAARNGRQATVQQLLRAGANVDRVDGKNGTFALLSAVENGHRGTVELLLQAGANADKSVEQDGLFPLQLAAIQGNSQIVKLLLQAGARADRIYAQDGSFPLLVASQKGHGEVVRLLLQADAKVDRVHEPTGIFPLYSAAYEGHSEVVDLLLHAGARVDRIQMQSGNDPLFVAAMFDHCDVLRLLLQAGAQANRVNEQNGISPLILAANSGNDRAVRALLEAGAKADQIHDQTGGFPLHIAAQKGHTEVVRCLLAAGAKENQVNELSGDFPLLLAAESGNAETMHSLLQAGAEANRIHEHSGAFALLFAADNGNAEAVQLLLQAGAQVNLVQEQSGCFPLLMAAQNGHGEALQLLLQAGAQADKIHDLSGSFPLLLAAQNGHAEAVELLLAANANPNQVSSANGATALIAATVNRHDAVIVRLIEGGAKPLEPAIAISQVLDRSISGDPQLPPSQEYLPVPDSHAETLPRPPILGDWRESITPSDWLEELENLLPQLGINPEDVEGFEGCASLPDFVGAKINLRTACVVVRQNSQTMLLELLWLDTFGLYPPLALGPGIDLDGLLVSLAEKHIVLDLRFDDRRRTWASLVAFTAATPGYPILPGSELPLQQGLEPPPMQSNDWQSRNGHSYVGPDGPTVELVMIDGDMLVRRLVLVPNDGRGSRILEGGSPLASHSAWMIPRHIQYTDGTWTSFRVLP